MGSPEPRPIRVGIVAIPDAGLATLSGIYDVLNGLAFLAGREGVTDEPPFEVEFLGVVNALRPPLRRPTMLAEGNLRQENQEQDHGKSAQDHCDANHGGDRRVRVLHLVRWPRARVAVVWAWGQVPAKRSRVCAFQLGRVGGMV